MEDADEEEIDKTINNYIKVVNKTKKPKKENDKSNSKDKNKKREKSNSKDKKKDRKKKKNWSDKNAKCLTTIILIIFYQNYSDLS